MAIVSVTETFTDRGGTLNDLRQRDYTRSFDVMTDVRETDPPVIRLATGIPRPWTPYINAATGVADLGSWCKEVRVKQDTVNPYLWRVTCQYSSVMSRPDINLVENPLLRPSEISWDGDEISRPAYYDRDGEPIYNAVQERFDPPVEEVETRMKLTIARNQTTYDPVFYCPFFNSVNSKSWYGFNAGRVLCKRISGARSFENGVYYWRTTYEFLIRMRMDEVGTGVAGDVINDPDLAVKAWAHKVLNQGYYEIKSGKRVRATDPLGQLSPTPVLLKADGTRLDISVDDPVFLTFHVYPERDFTPLLLP